MKKFELPKDWSWEALGECCEIVNGSTPRRSNDEYWGGDIKWVTPTEVGAVEGKYLADSEEKITEEGYESCSTTLLPENSVIYSSRASIGHIAINKVPVCTNQGFKSFVTGDAVDPEYLYYCLQCNTPCSFRADLHEKAIGRSSSSSPRTELTTYASATAFGDCA